MLFDMIGVIMIKVDYRWYLSGSGYRSFHISKFGSMTDTITVFVDRYIQSYF